MKKLIFLFLQIVSTGIINGAADSDKAQFKETVQQHLNEGFALLNPQAIAGAVDKILAEGLLVKYLPKLIVDALLFARFLANEGHRRRLKLFLKLFQNLNGWAPSLSISTGAIIR